MRRGVPFGPVVEGLSAALNDAAREGGPTSRLLMCFLRDLDAADAWPLSKRRVPGSIALPGSDWIPQKPEIRRASSLRSMSAPVRSVCAPWPMRAKRDPPPMSPKLLDRLKVERIDHGVHAIDDAALVQRLARERVPLTVCPLSNIRLCVYPDMRAHPIQRLFEAGVVVTVNSDDPAYFGGYVNENYRAIQQAFTLGAAELTQLAKNSFSASFLSDDDKKERIAEVDAYARAHGA